MKLTKIINFLKQLLSNVKNFGILNDFVIINLVSLLGLVVSSVCFLYFNKVQFFALSIIFILVIVFSIIFYKDLIYETQCLTFSIFLIQKITHFLIKHGLSLSKIFFLITFVINLVRLFYIYKKYDVIVFFINSPFNSLYAIKHTTFYVLILLLFVGLFFFFKKKITLLNLVFFCLFLFNFFILSFITTFYYTRTAFLSFGYFLPFLVLEQKFTQVERITFILLLLQELPFELDKLYIIFQVLVTFQTVQEIEINFINFNFDSLYVTEPTLLSETENLSKLETMRMTVGLLLLSLIFLQLSFQLIFFLFFSKERLLQFLSENATGFFTTNCLSIVTWFLLKDVRRLQLLFKTEEPNPSDFTDPVFFQFCRVFLQLKEKGIVKQDLDHLIAGFCQKQILFEEPKPQDSSFVTWFEWFISFFM